MDDNRAQRTETDERVAENQTPAPRRTITNDDTPVDPQTGLPVGMHDDDANPLDRGKPLDPFGGVSPAERMGAAKPGRAQSQAFASSAEREGVEIAEDAE